MLRRTTAIIGLSSLFGAATAHLAAFAKGMYCLNGVSGVEDLNSYDIVTPLYQLPFKEWWFHHVNKCDEFPPAAGEFLDIPAGGSFMVEVASNRAKTTLSYGGRDTSDWPDGNTYPEDYNDPDCIIHPNMHTQNQENAAGTVFAISYHSDIKQVTPDNLVVFTVRAKTPWKRVIWYDVPAAMPACPPGGCICAWGWVPKGCGQPNIYHQPFRCRVTGAKSTTPLAAPKPPVWCQGNPGGCTKGAKQMVYWNQAEGNNIWLNGYDQRGDPKSPGYNENLGFANGAQNDIFAGAPSTGVSPANPGGNSNNGGSNTGSGNATPSQGSTPPNTNTGSGSGTGSDTGGSGTSPNHGTGTGTTSSGSSTPSNAGYTDFKPQCNKRRRRRNLENQKRALNSHYARAAKPPTW